MPPAPAAADEAEFCRLRARAEVDRADEASHPAARAAHLELAVLYHRRLIALGPERVDGIEGWESEGGSYLAGE